MREAVVVAYGRAPVTRSRKGGLAFTHPVEYGAQVLKGVLAKVPQIKPEDIGDVIVGCAMPEGPMGYNMGRVIVKRAGLPDCVTAQTINRFCSSGLQAIATAANAIMAGQEDIMVAGGCETMTMVPMGSNTKESDLDPWMLKHNPEAYMPMGLTAENVAAKYGVTRLEMEQMAVESNAKAAAAIENGEFDSQIIPIETVDGEGNPVVVKMDDGVRKGTNLEGLAALKPCFKPDGVVTAATSSQTSDGCGFVVLMSKEKAEEMGIKPIAKFVGFALGGVPAELMGIGPIEAVPKVLKKTGLKIEDMDVIELNEAFAAQAIPVIKITGMDKAKVNPNGGALALGHPLGATGANLTCKALAYLEKHGGKYAMVTMCIGGGMGAAGIYEML